MTDQITFEEEPDDPPVILDWPTGQRQINDLFFVNAMDREWQMQVRVRDKNVTRELKAHYRIVHPTVDVRTMPPQFEEVPVPTGGIDPEIRELMFMVQTSLLKNGECHKLELAVSGHFAGGPDDGGSLFSFRLPGYEDDLATASWWVWESDGPMPADLNLLLRTCAPETDLLSSSTLNEPMP